jgi:hypothetical protein
MLTSATQRFGALRHCLIVILWSISGVQPASAYSFLPPECTEGTKACIDSGKLSYVSVYGPIRGQDEELFQEIDYLLPGSASFPLVYVNSPGGRQIPAMAIGRILRARQAEVRSGSPLFPDRRPECSSACAYLAAGAVRRYLSHIGIHSGHFRQSTGCGEWKPVALDDKSDRETSEYLREMGIPMDYDKVRDKTPHNRMTEFVLDDRKPIDSQDIVKLGFFQGNSSDFQKLPPVALDLAVPLTERREYLENAAILGLTAAIWDLVEYLNTDKQGDESNPKLAFEWLKQLAARNDGYAHYVIGNYYAEGFGTLRNEDEAWRQYLLAAEQGVGQAQAIVGRAYFNGEGVPRDSLAALSWSLRAAERGEPLSYQTLCEIYGQQAEESPGRSLGATWCRLAAMATVDINSLRRLQTIQEQLSKGMSADDLVKLQDRALNWRPLQDKADDKCAVGIERF